MSISGQPLATNVKAKCEQALRRGNELIAEAIGPRKAMLDGCKAGGASFIACMRKVKDARDLMACVPSTTKP